MMSFEQLEPPLVVRDELSDARIFADGHADVLNPLSGENRRRVWQEQYLLFSVFFSGDIEKRAIWLLPYGMKLTLYQDAGPLPDEPPIDDAAAVLFDLMLCVVEAISEPSVLSGGDRHKYRIASGAVDVSTETANIRCYAEWRGCSSHFLISPNTRRKAGASEWSC